MLKSLRNKLVLVFIILIMSVMGVLSTFLINSITTFYFGEFNTEVSSVFTLEVLSNIEERIEENAMSDVSDILNAYSANLGISSGRDYFLLDRNTTKIILSSSKDLSQNLEITPNITLALSGVVGSKHLLESDYLDVAIPLKSGIIYVKDNKTTLQDMKTLLFNITLQAMFVGVITAIILSLFLSKTLTNPIEKLTIGAKKVAGGEFYEKIEVSSDDEIGTLTKTFNLMSDKLRETLNQVSGEKNKLSTLFLHMTDGVLAFESDGKIINMNPKASDMLGVTYKKNLTFSEVFKGIKIPESSDVHETYAETLYETLGRTYRVLFAPLESEKNLEPGIIVVVYDITESKKLEDIRKEFVANVSHELRTPLTNIKSYTETILDNKEMLDRETEDKFLGIISSETDRMTRIVSDLLTLSRFDHGKMDMVNEELDTNELLSNVHDTMKLEALKAKIDIDFELQYNLGHIFGDRGRLEQVFINIISNAIKYSAIGKPIKVLAYNEKGFVKIVVSDQGFGISKEDLSRVFERFYRVDKARSREKGGTGLGLAITREIVDAHGGNIRIESELEVGTTVTINIPIKRGEGYE